MHISTNPYDTGKKKKKKKKTTAVKCSKKENLKKKKQQQQQQKNSFFPLSLLPTAASAAERERGIYVQLDVIVHHGITQPAILVKLMMNQQLKGGPSVISLSLSPFFLSFSSSTLFCRSFSASDTQTTASRGAQASERESEREARANKFAFEICIITRGAQLAPLFRRRRRSRSRSRRSVRVPASVCIDNDRVILALLLFSFNPTPPHLQNSLDSILPCVCVFCCTVHCLIHYSLLLYQLPLALNLIIHFCFWSGLFPFHYALCPQTVPGF